MEPNRGPVPEEPCVCGSATGWGVCCGPILAGEPAKTAEALMRSRYSAFVVGDVAHLRRSWHPDTRPDDIRIVEDQEWTGLEIVDTEAGRALDARGTVTFRASYRRQNRDRVLSEASRFERVAGRWVYVDGSLPGS